MKTYLCIDLKSFYASVECVERHLDPFKTKLVVADPSRGKGAICLAVSPYMKELGVRNRCRLFEIPSNINYIAALPRMNLYIKYSADIYAVYLKYVSKDDILVYSIDECFIDITSYIKLYGKTPKELALMMISDVLKTTGICATCGIGTNLFLAKVALDIMAKHQDDHIGYLDEEIFKEKIWYHQPLTDIWNIGHGISNRLKKYGAYDLHDITMLDEKVLYKEFGVNAEFLIDHAHGIEPVTIKEIHNYRSKNKSISNGQILFSDYNYEDSLLVVKEMTDVTCLELVEKGLITNSISLYVGYSKDVIPPTGGSLKLLEYTNSYQIILENMLKLFNATTNKHHMIRRINIAFNNVTSEDYAMYTLFTDHEMLEKEKIIQNTLIGIKKRYGKNSILKAMDLQEKATTVARNKLVGGHNAD